MPKSENRPSSRRELYAVALAGFAGATVSFRQSHVVPYLLSRIKGDKLSAAAENIVDKSFFAIAALLIVSSLAVLATSAIRRGTSQKSQPRQR